jgi:peptide-methionine (R)-S-oxide reductase
MMSYNSLPTGILFVLSVICFSACRAQSDGPPSEPASDSLAVSKSESEWREELPHMACFVLREKGTERAFTGEFWDHHEKGMYACAGCGQALFDSDHKFESGTGWPSFFQPAGGTAILEKEDDSWGMRRVEVLCSSCGGHLGHVFEDGPRPTGLRYCINSAALKFESDSASVQTVKYD